MSKRQNRKPKNLNRSQIRDASEHPPAMPFYQLTWSKRLRFIATSNIVNFDITYQMLLNTILFATTATAPYQVFDAVRVKFVEIWSPSFVTTTTSVPPLPTTCSVAFQGTAVDGDFALCSDTSMTIHPAHVKAVPRNALAGLWQNGVANACATINCPIGSVIDIMADFRDLPGTAAAALNPSVGATVGGVFYRGLDGAPAATTTMPPAGNVATF